MSENRMMVKMETILALWTGKGGAGQKELLEFLTGRSLSDAETTIVTPLVKGWLASQLPALMGTCQDETAVQDEWVAKQCERLGGENVSLEPIPDDEMGGMTMVLDKLAAAKTALEEAEAKCSAMDAELTELSPFKASAAKLEKENEALQAKVDALTAEVAELKTQTAEFEGKLPVAEDEINDTIKDIVTKALKDAVAAVPVGAAVAGGDAPNAAVEPEEAPAEDAVPDDFGFGASGASSDGFGF